MSSTNGVAMVRSQVGARGQAAMAPIKLPIMNDRTVVTRTSENVQGSASIISSQTVLGYLLSDTPRSKRARPAR